MKKILTVSIAVVIMCVCMIGNIYAMTCNIVLQTSKSEYEKGEEFTVDLYISNIQSERGAIALTATLDYDKTGLTLVKMEGLNGWETPAEGFGYNSQNGKIAITRGGLGKDDEVIFRMTFKVNENAIQNPTISLKNVEITDADISAKFSEVKKEILLKTTSTEPTNPIIPGDEGNTTPKPSNPNQGSTSSNQKPNTTAPVNKMPQTGINNIPLVISIVTISIIAVYFGLHMRLSK